MNEVVPNDSAFETESASESNIARKKSWISMLRSATPSLENNFRHSVGATLFNTILIILGIRVPYQKLYDVKDRLVTKLKHIIYNPFRLYSVLVLGSLCVLPIKLFALLTKYYSDELLLHFVSEFSCC